MSALKPFMIIACVAFTLGFVGYWAANRAAVRPDAANRALQSATQDDADDWNFAKAI